MFRKPVTLRVTVWQHASLRQPQRRRRHSYHSNHYYYNSSLNIPPRPKQPGTRRRRLTTSQTGSASAKHPTTTTNLAARLETQLLGETTTSQSTLVTWTESLTTSQRQALLHQLELRSTTATDHTPDPTYAQLRLVALNNSIPFVGFGFLDNAILIVAGDAIDTSLGVMLGISTMCAAAIGNIFSDVAGILLGTAIEDWAAQLNLPRPHLTAAQRELRSVRFANQFGCGLGIVVGCIIGMFPLLFLDSQKIQAKKQEAHMDAIFRDVVDEAGSLVGASKINLYIKVDRPPNHPPTGGASSLSTTAMPTPSVDGKYLYAKYNESSRLLSQERSLVPLGRGIISRAVLTGEVWKIDDVPAEPDYDVLIAKDAQTMICVPVLDGDGRAIAVIQAVNKIGKGQTDDNQDVDKLWWMESGANHKESKTTDDNPTSDETTRPPDSSSDAPEVGAQQHVRPFSFQDVQVLKALASHIGVSLQRLYEGAGDEEELRLRDTIQVLKKYGLEGLSSYEEKTGLHKASSSLSRRLPLFPDEDE